MNYKRMAVFAALLIAIAAPVSAQQGSTDPKRPEMGTPGAYAELMGPRMLSPEIALRLKDELKLTDAQASQLEAIRKEIVADRQARARDMIDIHSRIEAGLLKDEDVRKQFEGKGDAARQMVAQRQERIAKILTPEQQERVQRATRHMLMERMHGEHDGFSGGMQRGHGRHGRGMRGRGRDGFGHARPGFDH